MRAFIDTNVLVYAATADDPHKQMVALRLLTDHAPPGLTVSTQVLAETHNVLAHKKRWVPADALQAVRTLAGALHIVTLSADGVLAALQLAATQRLSTWDAMVVHAALDACCDALFSENLQDGRRFAGLQVVNPFALSVHKPPANAASGAVPSSGAGAGRKAAPRARTA